MRGRVLIMVFFLKIALANHIKWVLVKGTRLEDVRLRTSLGIYPGPQVHMCNTSHISVTKVKWKSLSRVRLFVTLWTIRPWNSPSQNTGVGDCSLLQESFPTQGWNPGLPLWRWILYQLSHKGSPAAHQASLSFTSPRACSSSRPLSWRCHPTSGTPFSSCLQAFSASWSFPVSWLLTSGGQITGASASASVLPMNIQGWFPLGWTGLISLQSKGIWIVFSSIPVWRHQFFDSAFFMVQLSHPYMTTGNTIAGTVWTFVGIVILCLLIYCLGLS